MDGVLYVMHLYELKVGYTVSPAFSVSYILQSDQVYRYDYDERWYHRETRHPTQKNGGHRLGPEARPEAKRCLGTGARSLSPVRDKSAPCSFQGHEID
jgi:hypothetical protein